VPGDYNGYGVVNTADYVVWRAPSGQTFALPNEGAGQSPGIVMPPTTLLEIAFGATSGSGSGAGSTSARRYQSPARVGCWSLGS